MHDWEGAAIAYHNWLSLGRQRNLRKYLNLQATSDMLCRAVHVQLHLVLKQEAASGVPVAARGPGARTRRAAPAGAQSPRSPLPPLPRPRSPRAARPAHLSPRPQAPAPSHWLGSAPPRPITALCAKFECLFSFESQKAPRRPRTSRTQRGGHRAPGTGTGRAAARAGGRRAQEDTLRGPHRADLGRAPASGGRTGGGAGDACRVSRGAAGTPRSSARGWGGHLRRERGLGPARSGLGLPGRAGNARGAASWPRGFGALLAGGGPGGSAGPSRGSPAVRQAGPGRPGVGDLHMQPRGGHLRRLLGSLLSG